MKPIFLLGEAMGANEMRTGTPFVGASGVELLRMLDEAGIIDLSSEDLAFISRFWNEGNPAHIDCIWRMHPEVYRANVFNFHPPGNRIENVCGPKNESVTGYPALVKSKYVHRSMIPELERLGNEIAEVDPNLVICLGNTPLWALCGSTGISKVRGTTRLSTHTVTGYKVLPTYHPAAVLRQWELRPTTVADLVKAKRESGFSEIRRPKREIWIEPALEDINVFIKDYILHSPLVAVDIETSGNQVTCIGFASGHGHAIVIPFLDTRRKNRSYWPTLADEHAAWLLVKGVLELRHCKFVLQNGLYDLAFLWRSMGIKVYGATEDSMLCHHALQPESLNSLGFLGSIYCDEGSWKQERKTSTIKRDE